LEWFLVADAIGCSGFSDLYPQGGAIRPQRRNLTSDKKPNAEKGFGLFLFIGALGVFFFPSQTKGGEPKND
jgi:hypothetical protein